jgi:hypothetical protein
MLLARYTTLLARYDTLLARYDTLLARCDTLLACYTFCTLFFFGVVIRIGVCIKLSCKIQFFWRSGSLEDFLNIDVFSIYTYAKIASSNVAQTDRWGP